MTTVGMKEFGVVLLGIRFVFYIYSGSTHSKLRNSDRKQQKHLVNRGAGSPCNETNSRTQTRWR